MRIISKFHDYYDSALKQGFDKETVYVREIRQTQFTPADAPLRMNSTYGLPYQVSFLILGFCGQLYKVIQVEDQTVPGARHSHYFYSWSDFEIYAKAQDIGLDWGGKGDKRPYRWRVHSNNAKDLEHHYNSMDPSSLQKYFVEKNVPIFIYQPWTTNTYLLNENASLKEIEFFKVKDVFTCFQDIYMYVSGVLNQRENPMVSISNQDKIDKHGFDDYSFRKLPTKHK
jgi:hypothetical protein